MKKSFLVLCLITAGALAACSNPNADWQKANQQNTVAAYQQFIQQHPNDARVPQARNRIDALNDEQAWTTAKNANTLDAYQQYLQQEPNGMHATDAQDKVNALQADAAWQNAQSTNTAAGYQDFLQKYPNASQAAQAQDALKKLTGFQALLASTRSKTPSSAYGSLRANSSAAASLSMSTMIRLPLPSVKGPPITILPLLATGPTYARWRGRTVGLSAAPLGPSWPMITNNMPFLPLLGEVSTRGAHRPSARWEVSVAARAALCVPPLVQESFAQLRRSLLALSLSKERVGERSGGRFTRSARSDRGTAEFRLTSPAARDARGDLS